jgi:hypothetical protein
MSASPSQPSDQKQTIELLARQSKLPIDEVARIYEHEHAELEGSARVKTYLSIFALRNVQETLRQRSLPKR